MMKLFHPIGALLLCASASASAADGTQGPVEQAVGFYSEGTLLRAMALPDQGDGFRKLFPWRDRGWSTYDLQAIIAKSASKLLDEDPDSENLQIGDMSARSGGKIGMHASHQNGLDADIAYLRLDRTEQDPEHHGFAESFVKNGRVTSNFDIERNWQLIRHLTSTSRVTRIFVDEAIKKAFCDYTQAIGQFTRVTETLRILRHWPNHADHMHVRLSCPKSSPRCVVQADPPPGDGCSDVQSEMLWRFRSPFADLEPGIES